MLLFVVAPGFAQNIVKGLVIDSDGHTAVSSAIDVWQDSSVVKHDYVHKDGSFEVSLPSGRYRFVFSTLGAVGKDTVLYVTGNHDLGRLVLDASHQLAGVTVKGHRSIVTAKTDRLIYNVENDRYTSGLTGFDVMARAPRLAIDKRNKTISMVGRTGVKVLINGRELDGDDAMQRLIAMRSEDISKIEVIPIPPSRYSAEGDVGYVNVITKKDPTLGVSGTASLWGQQNRNSQISNTDVLNFRSKKWELKAMVSPYAGKNLNIPTEDYIYKDASIHNYRKQITTQRGIYTNEIAKFKPSDKAELGVVFSHGSEVLDTGNDGITQFFGQLAKPNVITWTHHYLYQQNTNITAYTDLHLDSLGKEVTFTYNYHRKKNATDSHMSTIQNEVDDASRSDFDNRYKVHSGLIDFNLPFKGWQMETGVSGLFISNNSFTNLFDLNGDTEKIDPKGTNTFKYKEQTYGVYVSASSYLSKYWSVKAGLRYEHTHTEGDSPTMNLVTKKNYGELFPTAFLTWTPNEKNNVSLSYSRRITRPNFVALNPFTSYILANNSSAGSADLKPVISNSVELGYNMGGNLNMTLWANQRDNVIAGVVSASSNGFVSSVKQNVYRSREIGFSANYRYSPLEWLFTSLNGNVYYSKFNVVKDNLNLKNFNGWGGRLFAMADFTLNKPKTLLAGISYMQFLPSAMDMRRMNGFASCNAYISYSVCNDRLKFNLKATDIFEQCTTTSKIYYSDYKYVSKYFYDPRCVELSITYFFGKKKVNGVYRQDKDVLQGRDN